jgi:hypothetical protein
MSSSPCTNVTVSPAHWALWPRSAAAPFLPDRARVYWTKVLLRLGAAYSSLKSLPCLHNHVAFVLAIVPYLILRDLFDRLARGENGMEGEMKGSDR